MRAVAIAVCVGLLGPVAHAGKHHRRHRHHRRHMIEGTLGAADLQRVIARAGRSFRRCYTGGAISVTFTITEEGRAEDATVSGGDAASQGCLVASLLTSKFPEPAGGPVTVTVPFNVDPQ